MLKLNFTVVVRVTQVYKVSSQFNNEKWIKIFNWTEDPDEVIKGTIVEYRDFTSAIIHKNQRIKNDL